jgi:hypothetical protein
MKHVDLDTFVSLIGTALLGGDHSVEVVAPIGRLPFALEDILNLADLRLRLRCVLALPGASTLPTQHSLIPIVSAPEWDSRFLDSPHDFLLLIDAEQAFEIRAGAFVVVERSPDVRRLDQAFHKLWDKARPLEHLFSTRASAAPLVSTFSPQFWDTLIAQLAAHPGDLHCLHPRRFEELVAELLARQGLEARLTPPSRDGGRDVIARQRSPLGHHLYYVECKRYAPDRPVGVGLVRALYGVVEADRATAGLLVTTSHFTRGALQFTDQLRNRLALKDYEALCFWLSRHPHGGV